MSEAAPPDGRALAAAARRDLTPCGAGDLVWHRWGDESGPVVVLLHGGSGSWTHWLRNLDALCRAGRHVVVPDLPGFGDSAAPPDGHDADVLPHWLEDGAQRLLGETEVDLVGFSFGGLVAGLWAASHPGRLRRLVLVGAPVFDGPLARPITLLAWQSAPPGPQRDAIHRHNLAALMLARPESIDEAAVALHAANLERDRLRRRRLMKTDLLLRTLPAIGCPVAGIWGAEDALFVDHHDVVRHALAQAPGGQAPVFIAEAGHWVQYERAAAFDAALAAALAGGRA